jgi:hypothetical protein
MNHLSAHIPKSNMSAYINSTPKAPLEIEAVAEFVKGKPAIKQAAKNNAYYIGRLTQHLAEFDKDLAEWKASGEWKKDYKSWGLACDVALGMTKRWADKLIKRYNETESPEVGTTVPTSTLSEKAAVLAKVLELPDPLADLEAQLAKAHVRAGPSPESKPSAAPAPKTAPAPSVPRDLIGFPIPDSLLERWGQRQEVQDRITAASKLRCALEAIAGKGHQNPLYGAFDWQGMIRTIGQLQFHLGQCKPEVVCYDCDGDFLKLKASKGGDGITRHCHCCNDRGFITQSSWDKYAESKLDIVQKRVKARLAKCRKD